MCLLLIVLTLCDPMDCSPPDSSVHGILQERMMEQVVIPFSRRLSQPRDWTWVSCIAGCFFIIWATRKALFIFNWRIIASQYCIGVYQTSTWISRRFTHGFSHLNTPPTSLPIPPLYVVIEPPFEFLESYSKFPLAILHMVMHVSMLLSPYLPHSPPFPILAMSISLFSMSMSPLLLW